MRHNCDKSPTQLQQSDDAAVTLLLYTSIIVNANTEKYTKENITMQHLPQTMAHPGASRQQNEIIMRTIDLTKTYGQRTVVDHLNITLKRGEILGFLGANGAGKTTTIRMILSLVTPTSGGIELFGQEVKKNASAFLSQVGALIETPALYLHANARQNLRAFGAVMGGVSEQRIDEVLTLMDLRSRDKDRVRTFSLGMKQRLGIGIALLNNPDVLILDEPTNGLDPIGVIEMRDLLRRLSADGKAIMISSHILAEMQQICSRVAIIKQGYLIKEATVDELITQSGNQEMVIRVDRPAKALDVIKSQPWGRNARIASDGTIITGAPDNQAASLAKFLINAQFVAETIMPHESNLEQIFLDLTNDQSTTSHE
jgi:ABC-type multidrug transport system ATPase subunit